VCDVSGVAAIRHGFSRAGAGLGGVARADKRYKRPSRLLSPPRELPDRRFCASCAASLPCGGKALEGTLLGDLLQAIDGASSYDDVRAKCSRPIATRPRRPRSET
jgi:hypothetical protein